MRKQNKAYRADCLPAMQEYPDKYFDLAVVDPQYGIGEDGGKNRGKYIAQRNGSKIYVPSGEYKKTGRDREATGPEYFKELFRVSKAQIIWGANYFELPPGGAIVWDKCNDGSDQSNAEIAYNSLTQRVDIFRFMWRGMFQGKSISNGMTQQGNKALNEKRIHPNQKPVALYRWIFQKFAKPSWRILDTHLGSGSSRIASYDLNLDFTGFEIEPEIFKKQQERFEEYTAQLSFADFIENAFWDKAQMKISDFL